ncbi:serine/threonine protein kinase [Mesoplasma syrphidae]|uniref:Serine/threonine protein kinase n=1 Tax=Mesoplasma syrphidae TaxID=225999 RepID=A0A2K9BJ66_9MOLU|nr:serine/threonine-protein kinase [Mesoplasma syrphidae]AUF83391.1 serine/threonine protein kinase [Mesoplasma syrphidae]
MSENKKDDKAEISYSKKVDLSIGTIVDERYKIINLLGSGGFGSVYLAEDLKFTDESTKMVALKVSLFSGGNKAQKISSKLERDTFVKLSKIQNVVSILDFDEWDSYFYIVLELIQGGIDLGKKMAKFQNEMSLQEILYYYEMIAIGLKAIHAEKVVHRDLKPENVMIAQYEIAKISDFGISTILDSRNQKSGAALSPGTARYASPEQGLFTQEGTEFTTDIYSLGVMMYQSTTGTDLFNNFEGSNFKKLNDKQKVFANKRVTHHHAFKDIDKPTSYNRKIPQGLENIILKCLAKEPLDRYQNMDEYLEDLKRVKENYNVKEIIIPKKFKSDLFLKSAKQYRPYKNEVFFKKFRYKYVMPTVIAMVVLVLGFTFVVLTG